MSTLQEIINRIPKIELHLHLEGAIPIETLYRLMRKNRPDIPIDSIEELKERFTYRDFGNFIETWTWKNSFITNEEDFEIIAYDTLAHLASQNVRYVEAFYSPGDFWRQKLRPEGITGNLLKGVRRAERDFSIQCRLIADIIRDHGPETCMRRLQELEPFFGPDIIGIGLGGSEAQFPAELFIDVYRTAQEKGLRLTAHAGEVAGAQSVRAAVELLKVERIGHGLNISEDPGLVEYLRERQIPLEMCIYSNLRTGAWREEAPHPFGRYFREGLLVTLNSDDPTMFNTSINQEYEYLVNQLNFSLEEVRRVSYNSIDASFMTTDEKAGMRKQFDMEWEEIPG